MLDFQMEVGYKLREYEQHIEELANENAILRKEKMFLKSKASIKVAK
jgi:hypothetical protein